MPKVKMKVSMAGSEFSYVPGDIIEVRDDVAEAWVINDIAEKFVPPEEKAIVHKEETLVEEKEKSNEEAKPKTSPKKKVKKDADTE
ncbi:hypothetical protein [Bacillus sp. UNCCL81]|uniref:hypothetical protein n=1 Tax=Bacillus sp. UNCCL81 TaxID=1502755 RepID=UPI0008ECB631|nr:hypothetical protein [Bacillus sp. UNCCL81]SFD44150.1 hypothetical protein SAMN02799633_03827 [Bacillus sp. UNCCL81]